MPKIIKFGAEAIAKLKAGTDKIADAVEITLGPNGCPVVLGKKFGSADITKDGVTVAKEIELPDPIENIAAQLIREVASKTNDGAGDGTTTSVVLARHILNEGIKNVVAGASAIHVSRGIDKAVKAVVEELKKQAQTINSSEKIEQIATISSNNDPKIGHMIAQAMQLVGEDGVITVEEAKGTNTEVKVVEGMQFDKGYSSPYFVTNSESMTVALEDPYILITDKKLSSLKDVLPTLETVSKAGKPLFIISDGVEGEVLGTLVLNKIRGALKVCAVTAPAFGDRRKAMLEDIATLTGGTVISEEKGYKLENITLDYLGSAEKVNVDKENTTIVNGKGKAKDIQARVNEIKAQITQTTSDYAREKLQERLGKLSKGVAIIYVGGSSEVEMKEGRDRVNDALNATKAAVEEGIVPGGGVALLRASATLEKVRTDSPDEATGVRIIQKALEAPLCTILKNTVGDDGYYPILHAVKQGKGDYGYDARTHTYGQLYSLGVVDPAKVTRLALESSASVVGLLLRTKCVVVEEPKEEKNDLPGGSHMGGMPGMM